MWLTTNKIRLDFLDRNQQGGEAKCKPKIHRQIPDFKMITFFFFFIMFLSRFRKTQKHKL